MGFLSFACAQIVEFKDGKSLPLANESSLLRAEELIGDENWLAAAQEVIQVIEDPGEKLFVIDGATEATATESSANLSKRRFVNGKMRGQMILCDWAKQAPRALAAYRDLVEAESVELFENAKQKNDKSGLRRVALRYFASEVGDDATWLAAENEFEMGHFVVAAGLWDSLITIEGFPANSILRYPDTDYSQSALAIRSLEASLLGLDFDLAATKLGVVGKEFPNEKFRFLGSEGLDMAALRHAFEMEKQSLVEQQSKTSRWLDIQGRPLWISKLEKQPRNQSPFPSPFSDTGTRGLATMPIVNRDRVYWCDSHHIYSRESFAKVESDSNTVGAINANNSAAIQGSAKKIWSTLFPNKVVSAERNRLGRPVFELEISYDKLFARMGDPRTSYRNDQITRNRSYLIGLDLAGGGSVLPGFPVENEDPRVEFDATPAHCDGHLFLSLRRTFRDNASGQNTIRCIELSPSNRADKQKVVWERQVFAAESNNRGVWDEVTRSRLLILEDSVIFCCSGFVVSLQKNTGEVNWVSEYFRDRYEFSREEGQRGQTLGPVVRSSEQMVAKNGRLYLAPSDSSSLLCFDALTGICKWKVPFQNATHLIGVEQGNLIVCGNSLHWVNIQNGKLTARFPSGSSETGLQYGTPSCRGVGKASIDNGFIYWPTVNQIFVFDTQLDKRRIPSLRQIIDLVDRASTGGNLWVENGIMLLANEGELKAFVE